MGHKWIRKGFLITLAALLIGFAGPVFSATAPKVGDPMASLVPVTAVYDSSADRSYECNTGTLAMKEYDVDGNPAVDVYRLDKRVVVIGTMDVDGGLVALYGDSDGKGKITDVGQPFDPVFGHGPCDYLDNQVNQ